MPTLPGADWSALVTASVSADVCTDPDAQRIEAFERIVRIARRQFTDEDLQVHCAHLARVVDGNAESVDEALGLVPVSGQHSLRRVVAMHRRNCALRDALEILVGVPLDRIQGRTAALERLGDAIRQFEADRWPTLEAMTVAPAGLSSLDEALFRAFRAAPSDVPSSRKRLAQVCAPVLLGVPRAPREW